MITDKMYEKFVEELDGLLKKEIGDGWVCSGHKFIITKDILRRHKWKKKDIEIFLSDMGSMNAYCDCEIMINVLMEDKEDIKKKCCWHHIDEDKDGKPIDLSWDKMIYISRKEHDKEHERLENIDYQAADTHNYN